MGKPRLLDLFCGAGGCARGYALAGYDVHGVDNRPQKNYPYGFTLADAVAYMREHWHEYDVIHASPPCQAHSTARHFKAAGDKEYVDLVGPVADFLAGCGRPYIVENVPAAPLSPWSTRLCGLMFGLKVFRHRLFETSHLVLGPHHPAHGDRRIGKDGMVCVAGHGDAGRRNRARTPASHRNKAAWERAMRIDWMTRDELAQAIPPAYTQYIGEKMMPFVLEDMRCRERK